MKILRIRHRSAPWPLGCRWCGALKSEHLRHAGGWLCARGVHTRHLIRNWTPPTEEQYTLRMRVRFERIRRSFE